MTKPKITQDKVMEMVKPYNRPEPAIIVGIRGYYKDTMGLPGKNDRGIYDDAIILIGPGVFKTYNGNTDPSVTRKGIASLVPGVHIYRKGNHGISRPGGGYPALRPATPGEKLPVNRDGQGESLGVAINIHKGSYRSTSSEGCQTIYPDQWPEFIKTAYELMDRHGMKTIPYILVEG